MEMDKLLAQQKLIELAEQINRLNHAYYVDNVSLVTDFEFDQLLRELQDSLGVSYLFVTHNIGVVAYLADKVAVMQAGKIVEMGDASQILNDPQDAYTKTLLSAVPKLNQALV